MYNIVYDEEYDILYIREKGKGNFDYYGEDDDNGITRLLDQNTDELKGFIIFDLAKRLGLKLIKE